MVELAVTLAVARPGHGGKAERVRRRCAGSIIQKLAAAASFPFNNNNLFINLLSTIGPLLPQTKPIPFKRLHHPLRHVWW